MGNLQSRSGAVEVAVASLGPVCANAIPTGLIVPLTAEKSVKKNHLPSKIFFLQNMYFSLVLTKLKEYPRKIHFLRRK